MIVLDPAQEVFDAVYSVLKADGIKPYIRRPNLTTADKPLVYIGDAQESAAGTKDVAMPTVSITIAVWGEPLQRPQVSSLSNRLIFLLSSITKTANLSVAYRRSQTARTITEDKQDDLDLWCGLVDVSYQIL